MPINYHLQCEALQEILIRTRKERDDLQAEVDYARIKLGEDADLYAMTGANTLAFLVDEAVKWIRYHEPDAEGKWSDGDI